nr:putative entry exclusion protein TrbK-alt [Bradyrhizobium sp. Tv2a-2]
MVAGALIVLVVAACAIRLRGDESQTPFVRSADGVSGELATKLAECRSVTYEQKDVLTECRKVWAEKQRQFLGQKRPATLPNNSGSLAPKDEARLPSGYTPSQQ